MAQQTELSVSAYPGPVHSFLAKTPFVPDVGEVSERFDLVGTDDTRLSLIGTLNTRLSLVGTDNTRLTLKGSQ